MSSTIETTLKISLRHDWSRNKVRGIFNQPLLNLIAEAQQLHSQHHKLREVQLCQLISIKTGGCPEDCAYCPQSAHYETNVDNEGLLDVDHVLEVAAKAREQGVSRFCMGAAWREIKDGPEFDRVLEMVHGVSSMGLEVCCTLGMLTDSQARRLAGAGAALPRDLRQCLP